MSWSEMNAGWSGGLVGSTTGYTRVVTCTKIDQWGTCMRCHQIAELVICGVVQFTAPPLPFIFASEVFATNNCIAIDLLKLPGQNCFSDFIQRNMYSTCSGQMNESGMCRNRLVHHTWTTANAMVASKHHQQVC